MENNNNDNNTEHTSDNIDQQNTQHDFVEVDTEEAMKIYYKIKERYDDLFRELAKL